jgi:hypothetical protein
MPINYSIKANIIDITKDRPVKGDRFLVDSCVWFWMTYPNASQSAIYYQTDIYPKYVNQALGVDCAIFRAEFSFAELAHQIEQTEHSIYRKYVEELSIKDYRHNNPTERERIVDEIVMAWQQVQSMAKALTGFVDENFIASILEGIRLGQLDSYDLFILEVMKSNGIFQVITDDGDFSTIDGIQVFTANRNVIKSAEKLGKKIER